MPIMTELLVLQSTCDVCWLTMLGRILSYFWLKVTKVLIPEHW